MDDSKLRYFASAWLISITLPADSAERYNAQFVNKCFKNAQSDGGTFDGRDADD